MIVTKQLSKTFHVGNAHIVAVKDVDLRIERGQIYGIIGYSGAGKSTLIRLLNGLERADGGSIVVGDLDLSAADERQLRRARLKIGMIFQHFNLLWSRTVAQNIAFALEIAGAPEARIRERVAELVGLVGLDGREDAYPAQLSGGQKQRVGIARALANQPDVLLCDEATSALDPETTDAILDLLLDINERFGLTIVLITHEMHVVRRICGRVAVMEEGAIVEEGKVADLLARPREAVTRRFLRQIAQEEVAEAVFDPAAVDPAAGVLVKLVYEGPKARQPVLAEAIRTFGLPINILHGRLTRTRDAALGELFVQVPAQGEELAAVLHYLARHDIGADIVEETNGEADGNANGDI